MFVFLWLWHYAEHRGDSRASPRLHSRAVTRIGVLADARDSSFEILATRPSMERLASQPCPLDHALQTKLAELTVHDS